jgi:hypothetical protein
MFDTNPKLMGLLISGGCAFFFVLILALGWIVEGNNFLLFKVFEPKREEARREAFEASKAYNDGMAQELRAMQLDYVKAPTREQKKAIGSIALHRVAGYDRSKLPTDVEAFLRDVERDQNL